MRAGTPRLNRNGAYQKLLPLTPLEVQQQIVEKKTKNKIAEVRSE